MTEWTKAVQTVRALKVNNSDAWHIVRKWHDGAQNNVDVKADIIVKRFFAVMLELAIGRLGK